MWSNISSASQLCSGPHLKQNTDRTSHEPTGQPEMQRLHEDGSQQQEQHQNLRTQAAAASGSPLMRYKHAVCSAPNGFIFVHGGRFGNSPLDDDVWRFDPHQNTWRQLDTCGSSKPPNLQEHTLVEFDDQLYLFGGQVSASNQENSFWRLNLLTNEWQLLNMKSSRKFGAYLGPTNRRGHSAVVYKRSMYIFGGYEDFRGSSAQLWQYDFLDERWELRNLSSTSSMHPEPRHSHSAIVHQDSMYIYGGLSNLKPLGDLWRWSWRERRWFKERCRGQSPGQLHGHTAIQAFGSMFVFGGERQGRTTRSLWRLNLSNLCWQKIRPKGPRPNPTTWHAAIANPLNILDESNYIIENGGGAGGFLMAHSANRPDHHDEQDHQVRQQQMVALPNCFSDPSLNSNVIGAQGYETYAARRGANGAADGNRLTSNQQAKSLVHSRSSVNSNVQLGANKSSTGCGRPPTNGHATKSKKKLRLSFLRKSKQKTNPKLASRSAYELKRLANSSSANNFNEQQPAKLNQWVKNDEPLDKRHSIAIASASSTLKGDDKLQVDIEMKLEPEANVKILDNLDTDIKQMFQEARLSPNATNERMEQDDVDRDADEEAQMSGSVVLGGTTLTGTVRDSLTNSQLSSYQLSKSQTYQTANENLSSNSTLTNDRMYSAASSHLTTSQATITAEQPVIDHKSTQVPGAIPRRPSRRNSANNRPHSEIVQSLIDRADARIKHLYTPFFHQTNSGSQHRQMRPSSSSQQQQQQQQQHQLTATAGEGDGPSTGPSNQLNQRRRLTDLDKSKRHTIHQTMTYYNLYFSEDRNGFNSPIKSENEENLSTASQEKRANSSKRVDLNEDEPVDHETTRGQAVAAGNKLTRDDLSSSTIKGAASTSAALVGVRDGNSSGGAETVSQMSALDNTLAQSLGSEKSHTIRQRNLDFCDDADDESHHVGSQRAQHKQQLMRRDTTSESGDNTSMSFSVIAEFEEDDMLQFAASPAHSLVRQDGRRNETSSSDDYDDLGEARGFGVKNDEAEVPGRARAELSPINDDKQDNDKFDHHQFETGSGSQQGPIVHHKSTSSGYDSINSPNNSNTILKQRELNYCQTSGPTLQAHPSNRTAATSTSITVESLALTTSDAFESSLMSPTNTTMFNRHRQQQQHHQQRNSAIPTTPNNKQSSLSSSPAADQSNSHSVATTTNSSVSSPSCSSNNYQNQHTKTCNTYATDVDRGVKQSDSARSIVSRSTRFFSKKKSKVRYWQLCMFVIGGKQEGVGHGTNEPLTMWRLYI